MKISIFAIISLTLCASSCRADQAWLGTWAASPQPTKKFITLQNQTIREIVHVSAGGDSIRIHFVNTYGTSPLKIGSAHVALQSGGSGIQSGSDRAISVQGSSSFTIAAGAEILSDPIALSIPALSSLAISLYFPESTLTSTFHAVAAETNFISNPGDYSGAASFPVSSNNYSWFFISGVDIATNSSAGAVVTLGDSITDGVASRVDANTRWPDFLAIRLNARNPSAPNTILNEGIGYNRVLNDQPNADQPSVSALSRFDRDVLARPGVKFVVVMEGINDINMAPSGTDAQTFASQLIQAYQQMIGKAHKQGLKIYGATLTPMSGPDHDTPPEKAQMRDLVNAWIRHNSFYDGLLDFDQAIRNPADPTRILDAYDSGDHLHPNSAGYKAMADSIDLSLF